MNRTTDYNSSEEDTPPPSNPRKQALAGLPQQLKRQNAPKSLTLKRKAADLAGSDHDIVSTPLRPLKVAKTITDPAPLPKLQRLPKTAHSTERSQLMSIDDSGDVATMRGTIEWTDDGEGLDKQVHDRAQSSGPGSRAWLFSASNLSYDLANIRLLTWMRASYCGIRRSYMRPQDFPAEVLELIMWYSQNPVLPLTSKTIFQKLGHQRDMRFDMVLLALSDCRAVSKFRMESAAWLQDRLASVSGLLFKHPVAKLTLPPPTTMLCSRFDLESGQFGSLLWCSPALLRQAAGKAMENWLSNSGWDETMFEGQDKELFLDFINNSNHQVPMEFWTKDHMHQFQVSSLYSIWVTCIAPKDSHVCLSLPGCPGFRSMSTNQIFDLPPIPKHVLEADNDSAKEAMIRFYQGHKSNNTLTFYKDDIKFSFTKTTRDAIFGALKDKAGNIIQLLLSENVRFPRSTISYWQVSLGHLLFILACTKRFDGIGFVARNIRVGDPLDGFPDRGLPVVANHDKALVLMLAEDCALNSYNHDSEDAGAAVGMLEWWVEDNLDAGYFHDDVMSGNTSASELVERAKSTADAQRVRFEWMNATARARLSWARGYEWTAKQRQHIYGSMLQYTIEMS